MLKTLALGVSVTANAVLLAAWLGATSSPPSVRAVPLRVERAVAAGDFDRWRALGLGEGEARLLLFATLENAALGAIESPWQRYWRPGNAAALYASALSQAYADVRRELERRFGGGAAYAPEFARAFRPLEAQFGFLSSAEQIELQRRRLQARAAAPAMAPRADVAEGRGLGRAQPSTADLEFLAPAAAFEVALRDSLPAEQLRQSGVELDEPEFREAVALLARAQASPALTVQLTTRRELRALLGPQRFAAVVATRDPWFGILGRVGREHGLESREIAAAYEVLSDAQTELLEVNVAATDADSAIATARTVAAAERERLGATVGEAAALAILAAREEFYRRARSGDGAAERAPQ